MALSDVVRGKAAATFLKTIGIAPEQAAAAACEMVARAAIAAGPPPKFLAALEGRDGWSPEAAAQMWRFAMECLRDGRT